MRSMQKWSVLFTHSKPCKNWACSDLHGRHPQKMPYLWNTWIFRLMLGWLHSYFEIRPNPALQWKRTVPNSVRPPVVLLRQFCHSQYQNCHIQLKLRPCQLFDHRSQLFKQIWGRVVPVAQLYQLLAQHQIWCEWSFISCSASISVIPGVLPIQQHHTLFCSDCSGLCHFLLSNKRHYAYEHSNEGQVSRMKICNVSP